MKCPVNNKILFVHGIPEIGGAERELLAIIERLPRAGYQPVVVGPNTGALADSLAERQVPVREGVFPPWRKVRGYFQRSAAVKKLRAVIEAEQPALVHVNDFWWVPQTLGAVNGLSVPVVAHVRQEIQPWKAQRYKLEQVDLLLPVSRQVQRSLQEAGVPPGKLETLYSGLDKDLLPSHPSGNEVRRRLGISPEALVIGTVANLFPRKGYDVLIQALPELVKALPNLQYLIIGVGDPGYEQHLRHQVQTLGLNAVVHFVGFQPHVFPFLAALDAYVHPALMEGFGIAVLEAMAMGKPVLATRVGGLPEIVLEGETGYLIPPGDAPALANMIVVLLRDPALRHRLGARGRSRVLTVFTLEALLRRLTELYQRLVPEGLPNEPDRIPEPVSGEKTP